MRIKRISYPEWEKTYIPVQNHLLASKSESSSNPNLFEPQGEDLAYVHQIYEVEDGRIWTLVRNYLSELQGSQSEDSPTLANELVILSGYHEHDRVGYFITTQGVEAANVLIEVYTQEVLPQVERLVREEA
ncbi:hypothetical protein F5984_23710 [Rudanella paleaurantiibacter]|uniref:Uncharacterized protein n=1 Tax=Rudanella paleaurantiibacter TaxID=2614655 RepID=A0A7J5TSY1_9BACT|nr:hypothetical protein [Rudanella paleaurantiibacter]KAB7726637.1 hypothetical protein F5984_23710 [Rudanella paleaurantiibacter]